MLLLLTCLDGQGQICAITNLDFFDKELNRKYFTFRIVFESKVFDFASCIWFLILSKWENVPLVLAKSTLQTFHSPSQQACLVPSGFQLKNFCACRRVFILKSFNFAPYVGLLVVPKRPKLFFVSNWLAIQLGFHQYLQGRRFSPSS